MSRIFPKEHLRKIFGHFNATDILVYILKRKFAELPIHKLFLYKLMKYCEQIQLGGFQFSISMFTQAMSVLMSTSRATIVQG